jgi:hypothetical protein
MIVITVSGAAQHGKDSTANILKAKLESFHKKVLIIHMADYLKFICKEYYGWDGQKDKAGRKILQITGTEKVRSKFPDFWVDIVIKFLEAFGNDFDYIIIPDARFPNEINKLEESGFSTLALKVVRLNFENDLTPEQRLHPSERALDEFDFDYIIESESGLNNLSTEVDKLYEKYKNFYW